MLEAYDDALKSNACRMSLVDRAQTEPDQIERFLAGRETLAAITAEDLRQTAARNLSPEQALEVLALPQKASSAAAPSE
jgi:zinc protease